MRVLIACEFSGVVRDAFRRRGHEAVSCDLLESGAGEPHIVGDVRAILHDGWDMMIAHPPCTYLAVSGARWFAGRREKQEAALDFVARLMVAPIERIAIENPISVISSRIGKPNQIIQPWQFGHPETKATCLWLKGLPKLTPTRVVEGRAARTHREPPSKDRWKNRSRTLTGIASAMATQWGERPPEEDVRPIGEGGIVTENWNSFCEIDEPALFQAIKKFMETEKDRFDYAKHRLRVRLVPGTLEIVDASAPSDRREGD